MIREILHKLILNVPPYNHGLKIRHQWFKDFAVVEFVGPLMADIW